MNLANPMLQFDKNLQPQQLQQLMQLRMLLGGLGSGPASRSLSPSLARPPVQPEIASERPILGGTANG